MTPTSAAAAEFLHAEALCLDQQRWHDWLALYEPDAVYWVPSWRSEHALVEDPATEVSFTYLTRREQLAERVRRIEGGKTLTALPLPRTLHCVSNVVLAGVQPARDGVPPTWEVHAAWTTHLYEPRTARQDLLFGRYEYRLVERGGRLSIARKKVVLMSDRAPTVLDIYSV